MHCGRIARPARPAEQRAAGVRGCW